MTSPASEPDQPTVEQPAPQPVTPEPAAAPTPESLPAPEPAPEPVTQPPAPTGDPSPDPPPGWTHPDGWAYDWLDYRGDRLAVRIPNKSAIHAISNLKFSSPEFQQKLFHRFLDKHVSAESYQRITDRMVDPDDQPYAEIPADTDPLGEILRDLLRLGGERLEAQAKALAETQS